MTTPLPQLEEHARVIANKIADALPEGVGFALLIFDFGAHGHLTWLSNAERQDMIRALHEFMQKTAQ